jgi:hypothetical protein
MAKAPARPFRTIKPSVGTPSVSRDRLTAAVRSVAARNASKVVTGGGAAAKKAMSSVLREHSVIAVPRAGTTGTTKGRRAAGAGRSAGGTSKR